MKALAICVCLFLPFAGCDLLAQCTPTVDQHELCQALHGWDYRAMGRFGTEGVCGSQDFQCTNGESVHALEAADGGPLDGGCPPAVGDGDVPFCPGGGQP